MNAVTAPPALTPLRERLAGLLDAMAGGLRGAGYCEACSGIPAGAAGAARGALTEAAALGAYFDALAALAGAAVQVDAGAVPCGQEDGR